MRTPIDRLIEKYFKTGMLYETDFNEAKVMHKEEIIDAYREGRSDQQSEETFYHRNADGYYNEKFGGENE